MEESSVYRSIIAEGAAKKQREIALNLLRDGLSIEVLSRGTKLSIEEVQLLQQELTTAAA
jgi:predicted transposase YdaD